VEEVKEREAPARATPVVVEKEHTRFIARGAASNATLCYLTFL